LSIPNNNRPQTVQTHESQKAGKTTVRYNRQKRDLPDYGLRFYNGTCLVGEFHDQGDAKWIVIRLRGHNDIPFG
jgi:hypothetical protein